MHAISHALWCYPQLTLVAIVSATTDHGDAAAESTTSTSSTTKATTKLSAAAATIACSRDASSGCAIRATVSRRHEPLSTASSS